MAPVIAAKDLYKCYPGFAPVLRGASINVEAGEMAAIMGPSGCGKSTMLHILGMLHAPDSGTLSILDTNVLALNSEQTAAFRRENMGFVMQASNLFEHSTVFENVEFPLIYENVPPQERWERVIRALELVHLSARVHYRSNRLSGGEQQRVAIARAMVNNPRILLADEPTGALDARTSVLIMENFRKLCHDGGVAMIMVTHDPKMAQYCDSIYTLEEGQLKCQKHEPTPFSQRQGGNFLAPPEPIVRSALVAASFSGQQNDALMSLARRMHEESLLSRIYSLKGVSMFSTAEAYSLPLAVRRSSLWKSVSAYCAFFAHARSYAPLWRLWKDTPSNSEQGFWSRARAFASAHILAQWGLNDHIEFFYAAEATHTAAATRVCSQLLKLPYAFNVTAKDMAQKPELLSGVFNDASFVTFTTKSLITAIASKMPDLDRTKCLLLRPVPPVLPDEENINSNMGAQPDKPLSLFCMGNSVSRHGFQLLLACAKILKRMNFKFSLAFAGKAGLLQRMDLRKAGLHKFAHFTNTDTEDQLGEFFRNADMFVAFPPDFPGYEYDLPWYVSSAMAFGLPIILTQMTPAIGEALQADNNCIVPQKAKDAALLAQTIVDLASKPDKMHALGQQARESLSDVLDTQAENHQLADRLAMTAGMADRARMAS